VIFLDKDSRTRKRIVTPFQRNCFAHRRAIDRGRV
jgi:hypothetical protein